MIDTTNLPPKDTHILEEDPLSWLRNIDTGPELITDRRCCAIEMQNRTLVCQFEHGETRALGKIPMEKT
jgi:hypothetical protein